MQINHLTQKRIKDHNDNKQNINKKHLFPKSILTVFHFIKILLLLEKIKKLQEIYESKLELIRDKL